MPREVLKKTVKAEMVTFNFNLKATREAPMSVFRQVYFTCGVCLAVVEGRKINEHAMESHWAEIFALVDEHGSMDWRQTVLVF